MKNTKRSAFTIVELVIVIAVIAILSAVLIPTFGGIIKNANVAADQTAAATLTTELQIWLKGGKVDSEEKLMEGIKYIDPDGKKLVPKALSYGYHFWFDMETQTIYAMTSEEVADARGSYTGSQASGMRNIHNNGYYLVDSADAINAMFGDINAIKDAKTYLAHVQELKSTIENSKDYSALATAVLNNLRNTTIRNQHGIFYFAGANNNSEYFVPGTQVLAADRFVYVEDDKDMVVDGASANSYAIPTPVDGKVNLPSSVVLVEANALDYASSTVQIQTTHATYEKLASVLAPDCSNAIFLDTAGNKYIVSEREENGETIGTLHLYHDEANTEYKCDLVKRVPFTDYSVTTSESSGLVEWYTDAEGNRTLYVSITQSGNVTFFVEENTTKEKLYGLVDTWTSDNDAIKISAGGVLTFDKEVMTASGDYTADFIVMSYNVVGEVKETRFTVEIVRPTDATVRINDYNYKLDGVDKYITLDYKDGSSYDVTVKKDESNLADTGITYSSASYPLGSHQIEIGIGANSLFNVTNNKTLTFNIDNAANNSFTVSVDGCLETTFYINLNNTDLSEFAHNFYNDRTDDRPFYVGEGNPINLSSLFTPDGEFKSATITIYDQLDNGKYYRVNEINNTPDCVEARYTTTTITSLEQWNAETIAFNIIKDPNLDWVENDTYKVYVEITDSNNISTVLIINLVEDAENVVGSQFVTLGDVHNDIVLHGDVTNVTNDTKVNLGNNTLYGNGYKIVAKTYKPTEKKLNDYFISMNGGTIDNIYLEGPVYPWFDYESATNGTHVSGVMSDGNSTIRHSYLSGFRQPAACYSGTLNVDDTTFKGGNYGNIVLVSGTLNLNDVTTVQDQDGTLDTFEKGLKITGLGIVVDKTAIDESGEKGTINITGYLDQYNWVERNQTANLPEVNGIDTKMVFEMLFGVDITIRYKGWNGNWNEYKRIQRNIDFVNAYIHKVGTKEYVNTGIIFVTMGKKATVDPLYDNVGNIKVNDNRNMTNGSGDVTPRILEPQLLPQFSELPIEVAGMSVNASGLMEIIPHLEKEGGRNYYTVSITNITSALKIFTSTDKDVGMMIWSYKNGVSLDTEGYPINWTSSNNYYVNYGN